MLSSSRRVKKGPGRRPQCGNNENTNGLLREYFPKGVTLIDHMPAHLLAVEHKLNHRPRIVLQTVVPLIYSPPC